MKEKTLRNIFILSISVYLIYTLKNVLTPFIIAVFIAYLMNPLISFIESKFKIKNRGIAVGVGISTTTLFISFIILASIPIVNKEFKRATVLVKEYAEFIPPIPIEISNHINNFMESDYAKDFINISTINETINKITPLVKSLFSESIDLLMGAFGVFFILIYLNQYGQEHAHHQ